MPAPVLTTRNPLSPSAAADAGVLHWNDTASFNAEATRRLIERLGNATAGEDESRGAVGVRQRAAAVYELLMHVRARVAERQHEYESAMKTFERVPVVTPPVAVRALESTASMTASRVPSSLSGGGTTSPSDMRPRPLSPPAAAPSGAHGEQPPAVGGERPMLDAIGAIDEVLSEVGSVGFPEPVAAVIFNSGAEQDDAPPVADVRRAAATGHRTTESELFERIFALERAVLVRETRIRFLGSRVTHRQSVLDRIRATLIREVHALKYRALSDSIPNPSVGTFSLFNVADLAENADDVEGLLERVRLEFAQGAELREAQRAAEARAQLDKVHRELAVAKAAKGRVGGPSPARAGRADRDDAGATRGTARGGAHSLYGTRRSAV
jgi:hypothetical protein